MGLRPDDYDSAAERLFVEEQRITQPWAWVIAGMTAVVCWWIALAIPMRGGLDWIFIAMLILAGTFAPLLLALMHLRTEVRGDGVYIRYRPFHLRFKRFAFDEMASIEPRRYSPIWDYGGWGIRGWPGNWAYNVKGDRGVQIVLRSGKRVLIGTQRPEEFMAAVEAAHREPPRPRGS